MNFYLPKLILFTGKLRNLRVLGLNNNKVNSIPVQLCQLTELLVLGLESNDIHEIPVQLGNLYNLIEVVPLIIIKTFKGWIQFTL